MPIIEKPTDENKIDLTEILPEVLSYYPVFGTKNDNNSLHIGNDQLHTQQTTARITVVKDLEGHPYIVKEFPWYCSNETFVNAVLNFQNTLATDIPIPKILETVDGNLYLKNENAKSYFFIQEFIPGNSWNFQENQAKALGTLLGNFHRHAQRMKNVTFPKETIFEVATGLFKLTKSIDNPTWNPIKENFIENVLNEFKQIEEEAHQQGYNETLFPIHADYNYTNILFGDQNEAVALLDFDNSLIDNPIHDIAQVLIYIGCITLKKQTPFFETILPNENNYPLMEACIQAYKKTHKELYEKVIHLLEPAAKAVYLKIIVVGFLRQDFSTEDFLNYYHNIDSIIEFIKSPITNPVLQ